jgi:hypothetical protein
MSPAQIKLTRGVVYVTRSVNGTPTPLALFNQASFREWLGCWSAI